jgi:hypothetical protein
MIFYLLLSSSFDCIEEKYLETINIMGITISGFFSEDKIYLIEVYIALKFF